MSVILHKYGSIKEPIYSVGAGYQIYFPRLRNQEPHTQGTLRRDTMGKKDSQILFNQSATGSRFNAQPIKGFYPGNRIISERYRDDQAGFLSTAEADSLVAHFRTQTTGKAVNVLDSYLKSIRPDFKGVLPDAIATANVPAGEEQFKAVGGTKPAAGQFGAQPVDLVNVPELGNIQVTTERLSKTGHHGIYGKLGSDLSKNIGAIRKKHSKGFIDRDTMHTRIAKEGLKYFKKRLPTWNKALAAIKKELAKASKPSTAQSLSKEIRNIKGDNPSAAVSRMSTSAAKFQASNAATIVLQALGNMQYFGNTGVMYSYQLGPAAYAAFGQFIMDPNSYQFDISALKVAHVMDGVYDMSDAFMSINNNALETAQARAFAHNDYRVTQQEGVTKTNGLNSGHVGGQLANHSRFMSSIDMVHASKDMHQLIEKGIVPEVRKHMKKQGQRYSSTRLAQHRVPVANPRGMGWALPYISVFDTKLEKFGKR